MRTDWRCVCRVGLLVCAILFLTGCAAMSVGDENGDDPLPWNAPAGWENSIIGVPF
ncbi:MAG: hypothetical protein GXP31_03725 [Kiritimatiellaeota bacterium]|nr:hypothetical protein [Kiritimatiellota bacterium]